MDRILTFFVIIITFLSIFQKKLEIDIRYQTIILIIISFILIYRIPLLNFFLENFDEISIGNTRLKLKNIQKEIQKLEENGILDKDLKDIDEIRNKDETFLYGKFLLNFAKIEILLNNIIEKDFAIKKFTLKMLKDKYRQIFIKYKSKTLENLFLIFIEMVKFRNQIVHNGIEEKYEKEELHQIFIDFINIEEKIILKLEE